ncbi:MAG: hypothetical protein CMM58_02810 [Rhodospirillaceae bacterium]|nr:hypothetical protein [Rhodospirillaceae bacterium]
MDKVIYHVFDVKATQKIFLCFVVEGIRYFFSPYAPKIEVADDFLFSITFFIEKSALNKRKRPGQSYH